MQRLGAGLAPARVLPTLCFVGLVGVQAEEVRVLTYLVRCRLNGFMVALPGLTVVQSALESLAPDEGAEQVVYKTFEVALEDSRGQKFSKGTIYLADFSALFFCSAPALRGGAALHQACIG